MAPPPVPTGLRRLVHPALSVHHSSCLYPFKGIYYFLAHPFLYPLLRARLLPAILLSLFVLFTLFFWTYIPQVLFLAIFHPLALAWINGAFLVLGEGAAITALLFEAFFVDETLVDVFDAVLINEGCGDLVARGRDLNREENDPVKMLAQPRVSAVHSNIPVSDGIPSWSSASLALFSTITVCEKGEKEIREK
ncbi:hypothetical protein G7Y79_00003g012050 [Physcia stellaris]|nr:hypothetical protein G7Y79_00003g012050 [Physcia stellaris]